MTKEEIQKGLEANPDLKKDLVELVETEAVEHLKTKGHVIRTKDEETTFLANYEKEKIDPRVEELYSGIDKDIHKSTGIPKNTNEKTYEYLKRVLNPLVNEVNTLKKQIERGLDKNGDELSKQQIKALEDKLAAKELEVSNLTELKNKEVSELKQNFTINEALIGKKIAVPASVPDDKKAAYIKQKRDFISTQFKANNTAVEQDGKIVYKQGDKIRLNSKTNQPMTAEEIIEEDFQFEFEIEKKSAGGAGGSGGAGGEGNAEESEVTDKTTLYAYLNKKGWLVGSDEWQKNLTRIAKEKNITI